MLLPSSMLAAICFVSHWLLLGTAAAFGVALAQFVGASQLPVLPRLSRLNQTLCIHLLCSCLAPAPVLVVFKC